MKHDSSTGAGQELCQSLFALLSARLLDLQLKKMEGWCALVVADRYKLCWIQHYKTIDKIEVWPYFDYLCINELQQMVAKVGLPVTPRGGDISKGRAARYPLPIKLRTPADVERAVEVLLFAYAAKGDGKTRKESTFDRLAVELPNAQFPEGGRKTITVNAYERSSRARNACLRHYGCICVVCGFDFERQYGRLGKGFIHVHHVVALSEVRKSYKVDPIRDLRPVCPNCHEMLHRGFPPLSIDELKEVMRQV
jgi:hypothetical protein